MDYPSIAAKITGVVLLAWTLNSIRRHYAQKRTANISAPNPGSNALHTPALPADAGGKNDAREARPSISEQLLNNILLYLWLAFMLAFSTGMLLNN